MGPMAVGSTETWPKALGQSLLPLTVCVRWVDLVVSSTRLTDPLAVRRLVLYARVRWGMGYGSAMTYVGQVIGLVDDWTLFVACLRAQDMLGRSQIEVS